MSQASRGLVKVLLPRLQFPGHSLPPFKDNNWLGALWQEGGPTLDDT